jgi:DNA-binding CsgD family transcriptional regulator
VGEIALSNADLLAALALVQVVQSAPDLDAYRQRVLGLRDLVPCNAIGYNEVDLSTGEPYLVIEPPEFDFPGVKELFARFGDQHPVFRHQQETGDPTPHAISDFLTEDELHALDLYKLIYERIGAEDQLAFMLPSPSGTVVAVALNRATRGFSTEERRLIELVRPHLAQAFRDAHMRGSLDPLSGHRLRELGLSKRESHVIRLLVEGLSVQALAERLTISSHTARHHVASIYEKLGVSNRAAVVAAVLRAPRQID